MANKKYKTNIKIELPQKLVELADIFAGRGYELFVVGGYVRNALLGLSGTDIDICGAVEPDIVKNMLFASEEFFASERKSEFGTIAIHDKKSDMYFEYTALRQDSYGEGGGHRPQAVCFVEDIKTDALRRDFTIGALYAGAKDGYVYDPLGTLADLEKGIIKTTSKDPLEIIKDDGLRILRMVRFACELGFFIDPKLFREAKRHVGYLNDIAIERITDEFSKIVLSDIRYDNEKKVRMPAHYRGIIILYHLGALEYILPELLRAKGTAQNKKYHEYDVLEHLFYVYKATPPSLSLRLSGLLHDIGKPEAKKENGSMKGHALIGTDIAAESLKKLRYKNDVIKRVCLLIDQHMYDLKGNIAYEDVLEHLIRLGVEESEELLQLKIADASGKGKGGAEQATIAKWERAIEQIKSGTLPINVSEIAVSGDDLKHLGIEGKDIGRIKERLFSHAIRQPKDNNKQKLMEIAKSYMKEL